MPHRPPQDRNQPTLVIVRYAGDTHHARVPRSNRRCTCTGGSDMAAAALCRKYYPKARVFRVDHNQAQFLPVATLPEERLAEYRATGITHLIIQ